MRFRPIHRRGLLPPPTRDGDGGGGVCELGEGKGVVKEGWEVGGAAAGEVTSGQGGGAGILG